MAIASGVDVIAAFKKSDAWWTAVDVNEANRGICILNDTIPLGSPELVPDNCLGSAWQKGGDLGNTVVDGDINVDLRYNSFTQMFSLIMGAGTSTSYGDGAYYHLLTLTDNIDGYFGTYCVFDGVAVREVPSMKLRGFEITGAPGQPLTCRFMTMCDDRIVTGQENTTLSSVTYFSQEPRIMWDDVQIRINPQASAALTDADSFYASAFTITMERPMDAPFVTNRRGTRSEPSAGATKPSITITLTEDAWRNVDKVTQLRTRVPLKMDIDAIGATLVGSSAVYYHRWHMNFANVYWSSVAAPINNAGRVIPDLVLTAEEGTSTTIAGFEGLLLPFNMYWINSTTPAQRAT